MVERARFIRVQSTVRIKADQFLFLHRHFDEFDPKINVLSGSDKRKKKASYLSAINMDFTEAIVNNRSVKTVRKLQVLLSLHDENAAIE